MTVLLILLVSLTAYFAAGAGIARAARPALIARATYRKGDSFYGVVLPYTTIRDWQTRKSDGIDRGCVQRQTWRLMLAWPIAGPVYLVNSGLSAAMDQADPQVHAKMSRRIAELERDLELR